jgi:hypothetical protein
VVLVEVLVLVDVLVLVLVDVLVLVEVLVLDVLLSWATVVLVVGAVVLVLVLVDVLEDVDELLLVEVGVVVLVVDDEDSPAQTCVTLNWSPSVPPVIVAVALRIVHVNGSSMLANFGFASMIPEIGPTGPPGDWNVAEIETNASLLPGITNTHPTPWSH